MVAKNDPPRMSPSEESEQSQLTRRDFLAGSSIALTCLAATGAALSPLLDARETPTIEELKQKHYKRLTAENKKNNF